MFESSVIKSSGVDCDDLRPEHMVAMDLKGYKFEGDMSPSIDTDTHIGTYNAIKKIWWNCSNSLCKYSGLGTGRGRYSVLWNNACGLFLRICSVRKRTYTERDRRRLRKKYR